MLRSSFERIIKTLKKTSEAESSQETVNISYGFSSEHPIRMINVLLKKMRRDLCNDISTTFLGLVVPELKVVGRQTDRAVL